MSTVVFTGGGSAGHVTPNVALIEGAIERGWQVSYIGSPHGIERSIIEPLGIAYSGVSSGKLRRYFSWQNFIDPFRLILGVLQSLGILLRHRPDAVFSKGGFVSVPVAVAAWLLRIPVSSHESDVTPGLANRLIYPFCRKICVTFEETSAYLPAAKVLVTGTPVRQSLLAGDRARGLEYLGFTGMKPVLLVFGGSLGAEAINRQIHQSVGRLIETFDIVHVAGQGNVQSALAQPGYVQKAYIGDEFGDVMAAADLVVSRAGANTLYELFLLRKPHLLVPLTLTASRGDQIVNARTFREKGFSHVLREEDMSPDKLVEGIMLLNASRDSLISAMRQFPARDSVDMILDQIQQSMV